MDRWDTLVSMKCRSEAEVESRIVLPLLRLLGWHPEEIHQAVPVKFPVGRQTGRKPEADVVLAPKEPVPPTIAYLVVEAKKPGEPLSDATEQAWSYAFAFGSPFYVLTDGDTLQIWVTGQMASTCEKVFTCRVSEIPEKRHHLETTLRREKAIAWRERMTGEHARRTSDILAELGSVSVFTLASFARHQREAIDAVRRSLQNHQPYIAVHMAPQTGRTATVLGLCAALLESDSFKRILYVVDRRVLLEQMRKRLCEPGAHSKSVHEVFGVGVIGDSHVRNARLVLATEQILRLRGFNLLLDKFDLVILDDWRDRSVLEDWREHNEPLADHLAWLRPGITRGCPIVVFASITDGPGAPFPSPTYTYALPTAIADGRVNDFRFVQLPSSVRVSALRALAAQAADIVPVTDELVARLRTASFRRAAVYCSDIAIGELLSRCIAQSLTAVFGTEHAGALNVSPREPDVASVLDRVELEHRPVVVVGGQLLASSHISVDCIAILRRVRSFSDLEQLIGTGLRRSNAKVTNVTTVFFAEGVLDEELLSLINTRWGKQPERPTGA